MDPSAPKPRAARFGLFDADFGQRTLTKGGLRIKLQDQPFQVLAMLLDRPGELVTREEIRQQLWPADTFVEFDDALNTVIKKLRAALNDSADNPRFIETVPRRGYRFLAPVTTQVSVHQTETAETKEISQSDYEAPASAPEIAPTATSLGISSSPPPKARQWARSLPVVALALLAGVPLAALLLWAYRISATHGEAAEIRSIAVLPLQDLSPDPGQEYFADGITEELITTLAQTLPLRVISRTSVMRYKQTREPIPQIAGELGVEAIVEGSVARSGNRVTVTVQLIDAKQDRHLWARKYERTLDDILVMEAELSQQIASQVSGTLNPPSDFQAAKSHRVDPQVYELCLLGRFHWNKRTAADLAKSAEYYRRAIDRDPNYAPAYVGLANAYALLPEYDSVRIQDYHAQATAAAQRALELDEALAAAHATLGLIEVTGPDWRQSEREFRRAIELNPNYATAHHWYAYYLVFAGRRSEGLAEIELARQLDPLSMIVNADQGHFLYAARRYEEARVRLREAIELAADFGQPHCTLALVELETGHAAEAVKEARVGLTLDPTNPATMGEAGYVLAVTGHTEEARTLLATVNDLIRRGSSVYTFSALIQIGLGEQDQAMNTLVKMATSKNGGVLQALDQLHAFDELRADPRYQKLKAEPSPYHP